MEMNGERPDYSFEHGLQMRVIRYENSYGRPEMPLEWEREELAALPSVGRDPERDRAVADELRRSHILHHLGDIAIETASVGRRDAEDVYLMYYGWGSNSRNPVMASSARAMAMNNPDSQFVFTNAPGAGRSSRLTPEMNQEIRAGNYMPYGELAAKAVRKLTEGKRVHVGGHSLGSRVAIAATPFINGGEGIESLTLNDPPGSKNEPLTRMATSLAAQESIHARRYLRSGLDKSPLSISLDTVKGLLAGVSAHQLIVEPFGVSRCTLEPELEKAVTYVADEVRILLPDMSRLNDWRAIANIVGRIRAENVTKATLETWIAKGHTHSWLLGAKGVESILYSKGQVPSPFSQVHVVY